MSKRKGRLVQAWLNPEIEEDGAALVLFEQLQQAGWTQKQIIVDAVLRADGHQPEMYSDLADPKNAALVRTLRRLIVDLLQQHTQEMLEAFGEEVVSKIRTEGLADFERKPSSPFDKGEQQVTGAMKNLAAGFMSRQRSIVEDE